MHFNYRVTKKYDHSEGLSVAFRQWKAEHSHCKFIHGYALSFEFGFASDTLSEQNWVIDYGGLKKLKEWLKQMFDHTLTVAADDPEADTFVTLHSKGLVKLVVLPSVGCEKVAELTGLWVIENILKDPEIMKAKDCQLEYVKVSEHSGNSSTWSPALTKFV